MVYFLEIFSALVLVQGKKLQHVCETRGVQYEVGLAADTGKQLNSINGAKLKFHHEDYLLVD